ncbi:hypothetical protein JCM16418A_15250 [Paenibacillus pini]
MANIVHDDKLYNEEIKKEFISTHKTGTQAIFERIFKITQPMETDLGKDLYQFNREELRKTFYTFMASSKGSSKSVVAHVISYIDWAIDEEYHNGINPLDSVGVAWKEQFVVQPDKLYFTDAEIKSKLNEIVNAQVAVVFYAPFLGIRGTEHAEIVNIMKKDIDADKLTVKLTNANKSTRTITVDSDFIRLCNQAIKEQEFVKSNGEPDQNIRAESANLIDNDYIVRSVDINVKHTAEADGSVVYRRFRTLETFFNDKRITPVTIFYSGMIAMAKDLYVAGKLDSEGYQAIAKQFNLNQTTLKRHMKDFLNEDTIKQVYSLS